MRVGLECINSALHDVTCFRYYARFAQMCNHTHSRMKIVETHRTNRNVFDKTTNCATIAMLLPLMGHQTFPRREASTASIALKAHVGMRMTHCVLARSIFP